MLFFNSEETLELVAKKVFSTLELNNYLRGTCQNVLDDLYYCFSVFGVNLKLELNSYDYEDEYRFMLTIKKDLASDLTVEIDTINNIAEIVYKLLSNQLQIVFAIEKANNKFIEPTNGSYVNFND